MASHFMVDSLTLGFELFGAKEIDIFSTILKSYDFIHFLKNYCICFSNEKF